MPISLTRFKGGAWSDAEIGFADLRCYCYFLKNKYLRLAMLSPPKAASRLALVLGLAISMAWQVLRLGESLACPKSERL